MASSSRKGKRKVLPGLDSDSEGSDGCSKARDAAGLGLQKRRLYLQEDSDSGCSSPLMKAEKVSWETECDQHYEVAQGQAITPEQPLPSSMEKAPANEPVCQREELQTQPSLKIQDGQQGKRKPLSLPRNAVVIELEDSSSSEALAHSVEKLPKSAHTTTVDHGSDVPTVIDLEDDECPVDPCPDVPKVIVLEDDARPQQFSRPGIKCRPKRKANRHGPNATKWGPAPVPSSDFADHSQGSTWKAERQTAGRASSAPSQQRGKVEPSTDCATKSEFLGSPFTEDIAVSKWPLRYTEKGSSDDFKSGCSPKQRIQAEQTVRSMQHFGMARVNDITYELNDVVHFSAGKIGCTHTLSKKRNQQEFCIGRIVEFFETEEGYRLFSAQRFLRANDTATQDVGKGMHDPNRVFFSTVTADCLLSCIVEKVSILQIPSGTEFTKKVLQSTYYFNMGYDNVFSTFFSLPGLLQEEKISKDGKSYGLHSNPKLGHKDDKPKLHLLDLYSGCGAMSTGLCSGAQFAGVNLVTKWAVDGNKPACQSLGRNHPETEVYNMDAETFFGLIVKWQALFQEYPVNGRQPDSEKVEDTGEAAMDRVDDDGEAYIETGTFEVEKVLAVRMKDDELEFKVRWKGFDECHDTWEPTSHLGKCKNAITSYIWEQRRKKMFPLPGEVDVVCGGPPCQGLSGFNRYRNYISPLKDEKNKQIKVFMDIVGYLKPRYVLMENVVDLLKFCGGVLGRYALSRLVCMGYQASIGMLVAGSYGLPQFRRRAFLWGASSSEKLPAYPLPTHDVVNKGGHAPKAWENNTVSYSNDEPRKLERALVLEDAISDLPPVENSESRDFMNYDIPPRTQLQRFLRHQGGKSGTLYDHRPLTLKEDDMDRVLLIPKRKGANYRDLEGVIIKDDNTASLVEGNQALVGSGKPLVPNYALKFNKGKSTKPFGRLWWDEIVSTVVTRAEPHNQAVLHPQEDRVLTVRENARLQGFPDSYKLFGDIKERYKQVGNAVAFPVSRALGYSLGLTIRGLSKCGSATIELPAALYSLQE